MKKLEDIKNAVLRTGFVLEHSVSRILQRSGWNVINNRYYIDDRDHAVREIDIIAYKAQKINNITVFSSLIISCKKSEDKSWVFLARDKQDGSK